MKTLEIKGDNYFGRYDHIRKACRAVIIDNSSILLSCETRTDLWMLPGGGLEPGEKGEECVIREVAKEIGNILSHQN